LKISQENPKQEVQEEVWIIALSSTADLMVPAFKKMSSHPEQGCTPIFMPNEA
jgi:hypothetical protein